MNQIVRLVVTDLEGARKTTYKSLNISEEDYKKFGYLLNEEIAEIFFYDTVLLVEGISEKYFYNALSIKDDTFRNFIQKNHIGIFNVMGIDFSPAKELLSKLGIHVLIKTDNDVFKVPNLPKKRYAGIERVIDCVSEKSKNDICSLLKVKEIDKETFRFPIEEDYNPKIESSISELVNIFAENGIYISTGHNGFEEDFLNFIGENEIPNDDLEYLKKAKLKNLHKYVLESNIELRITDLNKDSILLRFMKNEYK